MTDFNNSLPVVVVGSGLAGLATARLVAEQQPVILLTKRNLTDSNTQYSQGGIAAVWSSDDSIDLHIKDTLGAGSGMCNPDAVRILSAYSKEAILKLIELGVIFDKDPSGKFLLGLEGAHSLPRILHAGGDATGAEIQRALSDSVSDHPNITILKNSQALSILTDNGKVSGLKYCASDNTIKTLDCSQLVIATGGAGQLYKYTSNPETATGEGIVLAYRAGAELADLEFFQFHPTALNLKGVPNFLISEAVRGEGAILRNSAGQAYMAEKHPLKDLAPRDIVARANAREMLSGETVYLDATAIGSDRLRKRFPTISKKCLEYGIDIGKDQIPVTPVAHCMMGGITTDLMGRTTVPGLYANGEVARTGVHGSNRLASNSLLECAVFSIRTQKAIQEDQQEAPLLWKNRSDKIVQNMIEAQSILDKHLMTLSELQDEMWSNAGIIRSKESLKHIIQALEAVPVTVTEYKDTNSFELHALKVLGKLIAESALRREESRGNHFRSDFPEKNQGEIKVIRRSIFTR